MAITQRPTDVRTRAIDDLSSPDLIIQASATVAYHCWQWFKAGEPNSWKIMRVTTTTVGATTTTKNEYPFGCAGYNFNPDDAAGYAYLYKY